MLHQSMLVPLDEAIVAMSQEEVCMQLRRGIVIESSYRVADKRGYGVCHNCGQPRHINPILCYAMLPCYNISN